MPVPHRSTGQTGCGGRGCRSTAWHYPRKKSARQEIRYLDRRSDLAGAAQMPRAGAVPAGFPEIPVLLQTSPTDLCRLHRSGRAIRIGRVLVGCVREHRLIREWDDDRAGDQQPDQSRAGCHRLHRCIMEQDLREAGQRLQKARCDHRLSSRELSQSHLVAADWRSTLCWPINQTQTTEHGRLYQRCLLVLQRNGRPTAKSFLR